MVVASEPYDTTTYSKIKNGLYSLYSKNLISSDEYELKRKAYYSDIFESNTFGPDRALTNYLEYEKQYLQLETNNQKNIIYARVKDGLYSLFRSSLITRDEYELTRKAYYSDIFESNTFGPDRALANYLEYEKNISEKIIKTPINTPNIQISPNNRFYTRVKAQYEVKL